MPRLIPRLRLRLALAAHHQSGVANHLPNGDVEIEVAVRRNLAVGRAGRAISERGGNPDLVAAAFAHLLKRFAEAGDDLRGDEGGGAASLGRVEYRSVGQPAFIF